MLEFVNKGKKCSVEACENKAFCKGFCNAHYEQMRHHGKITNDVIKVKPCARGGITAENPREYKAWLRMKTRCLNKNDKSYEHYGARGITICDRWKNSFANFLEDMGKMGNKNSVDRIDPQRGYSPDNCRWADWWEQQRNRSNNRQEPCVSEYEGGRYRVMVQHDGEIFSKVCDTKEEAIKLRDAKTEEWRTKC